MPELAKENAGAKFVWLDLEDDSALVGELEIENFPTLASLARDDRDAVEVPEEISGLPEALGARL